MIKYIQNQDKEEGAVLLTTLLLMTVMAALAVAIMDDIRFSVKRQMSVQTVEQADWYMLGGEAFARNWLQENALNRALIHTTIKQRIPIIFPLENAQDEVIGEMQLVVSDGRNCFNLNRLANEKSQNFTRTNLRKLLTHLEFDDLQAETIAASIQDWVDKDTIPTQGGAEGGAYSGLVPPYHPANTLMVDITELRMISGITEPIFRKIAPYVCALPDKNISRLNLDTLSSGQWPLLAAIFGDDDNAARAAQAVIALRPEAGYDSTKTVWALPVVEELDLKGVGLNMVDVKTDIINVNIRVSLAGLAQKLTAVTQPEILPELDPHQDNGLVVNVSDKKPVPSNIGFTAWRFSRYQLGTNNSVKLIARRGAF